MHLYLKFQNVILTWINILCSLVFVVFLNIGPRLFLRVRVYRLGSLSHFAQTAQNSLAMISSLGSLPVRAKLKDSCEAIWVQNYAEFWLRYPSLLHLSCPYLIGQRLSLAPPILSKPFDLVFRENSSFIFQKSYFIRSHNIDQNYVIIITRKILIRSLNNSTTDCRSWNKKFK